MPKKGVRDSEQLESIENIYTLKKIQNKVKDRLVAWFDFSAINGSSGVDLTAIRRNTEKVP